MTRPRTGQRNPPATLAVSAGASILAAAGSAAAKGAPASAVATRCGGCEWAGAETAGACPPAGASPTATRVGFAPGIVNCWPILRLVSRVMLLALAIADLEWPSRCAHELSVSADATRRT